MTKLLQIQKSTHRYKAHHVTSRICYCNI